MRRKGKWSKTKPNLLDPALGIPVPAPAEATPESILLPKLYSTFLDEHLNATIQIIIKMIMPMMITMLLIMV